MKFVTFPGARIYAHPHALAVTYPSHEITQVHDTDAHTAGYWVTGESRIPRLSLASLRNPGVLEHGRLYYAFLDCDNPGHTPWADTATRNAAVARWADHPLLADACVYSTRAGWRAVWRLARPLMLDVANSWLSARLASLSAGLGIAIATDRNRAHIATLDPCAARWTTLYRLPFVVRDGVRQVPWIRL